MASAKVTLEVLALDTNAAAHLASDGTQAPCIAAQSAAPGGNRTGPAVFDGNLAKAEKFVLARHCGISMRFDASMMG